MVAVDTRPPATVGGRQPRPPALTVAIAASGPEQPLLATLRSLALETEVPCEILVIDDGLPDPTTLATASDADPRIRICRTEHPPLGEVAALRRAITESTTPLITLLRPGDRLVPGALRAVADTMRTSADIGVAHAYGFPVDSLGRVPRSVLMRHRERLLASLPATIDHRRALVVHGNILQALPTFRRDALSAAGGLTGASLDEALYAATLRVLNHAEARLVPRLLCGRPSPDGPAPNGDGLRAYLRALRQCARILRDGGAEYLRTPRYHFARLAVLGLFRQLTESVQRAWTDVAYRRAQQLVYAARSAPLLRRLVYAPKPYAVFATLLRRWSFDTLRPPPHRPRPAHDPRIAYVLSRYPVLSQTFVRREVQALRSAGLHVDVFALEPDDPPAPADPESPAGAVTYFGPPDTARGRAIVHHYLRRKPLTVVRLWLFIARLGGRFWWQDRDTLYLAAQLTALLAERGITHVHAPWANQSALLALVASRLLDLPYTVQARASEIHTSAQAPLVADRLRFADFVVTNSRYNEHYLRSLLGGDADVPIHRIYNGLELSRFRSPATGPRDHAPLRLLSVGRLIEPKGFRYLLRACHLLRERGVEFTCEIIGGPQDPDHTVTWLELRKLHTALGLESIVCFRGAMPFSCVLASYQRSDVFVLPCVRGRDGSHDITPNTLIEAMAMRLPVVSTTSGAIPEIVDHEIDGLLVPPNDEHALANALERLLRDPVLRCTLGHAARRKVEEHFDVDRNVQLRATLFRSLSARP